ncbi:MAG: lipopolysaccharide biosynthesis protein [Bacteroidota bacterium]
MDLKELKKNEFILNIITLISGTAIAQGILFAATPFLSRLFSPAEFGYFSIYAAIVGIMASVSSLKYELAIMLPEKEEDASAMFFLSVICSFAVSLLSFIVILLTKSFLIKHVTDKIETFIWIVPAGILFSGLLQVLIAYSSRQKAFKSVSYAKISQAGVTVSSQSLSKTLIPMSNGLIWGKLLGDLFGVILLIIRNIRKSALSLKHFDTKRMQKNAIRYQKFPKYQFPAQLLSSISQNIPFFLLTAMYAPEIAGFYMLTSRVLRAPAQLISKSTREVYYQRASRLFESGKSILSLYTKTTLGLAKIAFVPFLLIIIGGPFFFEVVFGAEWHTAGVYARIIALWSFLGFINPPSTMSLYILGLQKFSLKYESFMVVFRILSLYIPFLIFNDDVISIITYSIIGITFNTFMIQFIYKKIKHNHDIVNDKS